MDASDHGWAWRRLTMFGMLVTTLFSVATIPVLAADGISSAIPLSPVVDTVDINVTETVAVTDAPQVTPPANINVSETVTVSDVPQVTPPASISVTETVGVSDAANVTPPASISVTETVSVSDSAQVTPPASISITETVAVSDSVQVLPSTSISVTETVAVTDQVQFDLGQTLTLSVVEGWNLLSVPLDAPDQTFGALLSPCSAGFFFEPGQGYDLIEGETALPPGDGFWANCGSGSTEIAGTAPDSQAVAVAQGWNMIGPFADSVDVGAISTEPSGILASDFFGYGSGYTSADSLRPGRGYWVKSTQDGILDLSGDGPEDALAAATAAHEDGDSRSGDVRLVLRDAEGQQATLRLASDLSDAQRQRAVLPPTPPSEVFDVRFDTDRSVAEARPDADGLHAVETQGLTTPVTVRVEGGAGTSRVQIRHGTGAETKTTELTPDQPAVELSSTERLAVGLKSLPTDFVLRKTSPNPVSKTTGATIRYAVPEKTHVTIAVYDVLGRRMAQLVDVSLRAGEHTVSLDSRQLSDLPSGTYFYRMQAGDFSQTRRFTVVK